MKPWASRAAAIEDGILAQLARGVCTAQKLQRWIPASQTGVRHALQRLEAQGKVHPLIVHHAEDTRFPLVGWALGKAQKAEAA